MSRSLRYVCIDLSPRGPWLIICSQDPALDAALDNSDSDYDPNDWQSYVFHAAGCRLAFFSI